MTMRAFLYNAKGRDQEIPLEEINLGAISEQTLLWIDLEDASDEEEQRAAALLGVEGDRTFGKLNANAAELQSHGNFLSVRVGLPHQHDGDRELEGSSLEVAADTILVIISERWLVTIHTGAAPLLEQFRGEDSAETMIGALSPASLAAALIDLHLGLFFEASSAIAVEVDALDERVLRDKANKSLLGRIVTLRRKTTRLRVALVTNRPVFYGLSRPDCSVVSQSDAGAHYTMLSARFERALDEVERLRDLINGSFDLFASRSGLQTNTLVKALTVITAILGYFGAIAGLFGMNLKSSLFEGGNGEFAVIVGALSITTAIALIVARWRKWI